MLYYNNGNGTFSPSPLANQVGLSPGTPSSGAIFADYDNDGDQDLYVLNQGANVLFRNDEGSFTDVTALAGVGDVGKGSTGSWGDYNHDGYVDLYVANWWDTGCREQTEFDCAQNSDRLYQNNGDGTFTDVTTSSLGITSTRGLGFVAGFVDYDNDYDLDIYLINDQYIPSEGNTNGNHLWRNDGPGCDPWCWTEVSTDTSTDLLLCGMGLAIGDYDKDGDLDFYFSNYNICGAGGVHHLLQNQTSQGSPTFVDVSAAAGVDTDDLGWGTVFIDYDNDSWLDLFAVAGWIDGNNLFHNNGDGTFTDVSSGSGADDTAYIRGLAYADYNGDGWVDMITSRLEGLTQARRLYRNQGALNYPNRHYLTVRLVGDGVHVNRDAVEHGFIWTLATV